MGSQSVPQPITDIITSRNLIRIREPRMILPFISCNVVVGPRQGRPCARSGPKCSLSDSPLSPLREFAAMSRKSRATTFPRHGGRFMSRRPRPRLESLEDRIVPTHGAMLPPEPARMPLHGSLLTAFLPQGGGDNDP